MKKKIFGFVLILVAAAFVLFWTLPLPGTIPVMMYHFVGPEAAAQKEKNYVSEKGLERQMEFLRLGGYRVITMEDYEAIRAGRKKPRGREVVITFDDGHYTFESLALPILKKYSFPVMLFIVSDWVKGRTEDTGSMTSQTLKKLLADYSWISLGSHSKTHAMLTEADDARVKEEIETAKKDLEILFGIPFPYFAYPFGNYDDRSIQSVKNAGYRLAFTTSPKKLLSASRDDYQVNRIKISRSADNPAVLWFKLSGIYEYAKRRRRAAQKKHNY